MSVHSVWVSTDGTWICYGVELYCCTLYYNLTYNTRQSITFHVSPLCVTDTTGAYIYTKEFELDVCVYSLLGDLHIYT